MNCFGGTHMVVLICVIGSAWSQSTVQVFRQIDMFALLCVFDTAFVSMPL